MFGIPVETPRQKRLFEEARYRREQKKAKKGGKTMKRKSLVLMFVSWVRSL
jgi:hypothetical protein